MTGWPVRKIQDICAAVNVGHVGTSSDVRDPNGISFLMGKNVGPGHLKLKSLERVQPSFHATQRKSQLQEGDVVVVRIGNSGQAAKIPVGFGEANCSGLVIIKSPQDVMADYLVYFLNSPQGRKYSVSNAKGSTRQTLNTRSIAETPVPVPPMEEQKRIVALLDAATARVNELTACFAEARTHANNLFTSASRDAFASNPDWPVKTLGDVCDLVGGGTPSKDRPEFYGGDIPWATVRDLNVEILRSTEHSITAEALKSSSSNVIPAGSVVIATRVGLGKAVMLAQNTAINQDLRGLVVKNQSEVLSDYLFRWYLSMAHLVVAAGTGATVQGVKLPFVSGLEIPLPPLDEQRRIVELLDSMREKTSEMIAAYDAKLTAAKNLRQSILNSAFAGEL
jgi:type I restriction enzyme S subunit